jgi:magnesium transporter
MGEVIEGIGAEQRKRIDELRKAGGFFWIDVSLSQTSGEALGKALGIPDHALDPLLGFRQDLPPSRKFHVDDEHVVFAFTCFLDQPDEPEAIDPPLNPLEVHILITGDYILTLHQRAISLPDVLDPDPPAGRSEQYLVYAILDAMVATGFDALNEAELTLEGMQLFSTDMRTARVRMGTLRAVNSRLARMRRRLGPQRGIFERISEEIGRIKGLQADSQQYFERIYLQLSRLVDGIDAASDGMAKLIDLRLNETIYWLTVVATVFLPLTFVTGFFGQNFGWLVRHISTELAFLVYGVGGLAVSAVLLLLWFRRSRYL